MYLHQISDIYEFTICPYRWYQKRVLLIDYDNIYTIEGRLSDIKKVKRTIRKNNQNEYEAYDVPVGDGSELYGICDTVIFRCEQQGVSIPQLSKDDGVVFTIFPMEYKQKEHQKNLQQASHLQCVAQARCLENMFHCEINTYCIYYKQEHRRKQYAITFTDRERLQHVIEEMNSCLNEESIPQRIFIENSCPKCSMYEYCLPNKCKSLAFEKYIQKEGN